MVEYYYDPTTGRFISIDDTKYLDFEVVFVYNRYAYCCNNPVMGYDPEGTWRKWVSVHGKNAIIREIADTTIYIQVSENAISYLTGKIFDLV